MCKSGFDAPVYGSTVLAAKVWSKPLGTTGEIPYRQFPAAGSTYHGEYSVTYYGASCHYMYVFLVVSIEFFSFGDSQEDILSDTEDKDVY